MDREDIRNEIRRMVQDTSSDTTNRRWSDTELNDRISQSHERTIALTKCLIGRITDGLVTNTQEYELPSYFLAETQVLWLNSASEWRPLEKTTEQELNFLDPNWRATTGSELSSYYLRGSKVGLYPCPDFTRSSALRLDIVMRPTFSDDDDIPFNGIYELYPFHEVICYEVASKCKMDEKLYDESAKLEAKYQMILRDLKGQVNSKSEDTRIVNIYEQVRTAPRRVR